MKPRDRSSKPAPKVRVKAKRPDSPTTGKDPERTRVKRSKGPLDRPSKKSRRRPRGDEWDREEKRRHKHNRRREDRLHRKEIERRRQRRIRREEERRRRQERRLGHRDWAMWHCFFRGGDYNPFTGMCYYVPYYRREEELERRRVRRILREERRRQREWAMWDCLFRGGHYNPLLRVCDYPIYHPYPPHHDHHPAPHHHPAPSDNTPPPVQTPSSDIVIGDSGASTTDQSIDGCPGGEGPEGMIAGTLELVSTLVEQDVFDGQDQIRQMVADAAKHPDKEGKIARFLSFLGLSLENKDDFIEEMAYFMETENYKRYLAGIERSAETTLTSIQSDRLSDVFKEARETLVKAFLSTRELSLALPMDASDVDAGCDRFSHKQKEGRREIIVGMLRLVSNLVKQNVFDGQDQIRKMVADMMKSSDEKEKIFGFLSLIGVSLESEDDLAREIAYLIGSVDYKRYLAGIEQSTQTTLTSEQSDELSYIFDGAREALVEGLLSTDELSTLFPKDSE
ncbi:MAG: hypothetical protein OXB88_03640 [Bacteriovoracales bacterium]|nr:hypothetical protein [Bacteriovoracales bacterium]